MKDLRVVQPVAGEYDGRAGGGGELRLPSAAARRVPGAAARPAPAAPRAAG